METPIRNNTSDIWCGLDLRSSSSVASTGAPKSSAIPRLHQEIATALVQGDTDQLVSLVSPSKSRSSFLTDVLANQNFLLQYAFGRSSQDHSNPCTQANGHQSEVQYDSHEAVLGRNAVAMVEALSKVDPPIDLLNLLDKSGNNPLYYCPSLEEKHVQRIKANHSKLIAGKLKEVAKRVRDDATLPKDRHDKPKM